MYFIGAVIANAGMGKYVPSGLAVQPLTDSIKGLPTASVSQTSSTTNFHLQQEVPE